MTRARPLRLAPVLALLAVGSAGTVRAQGAGPAGAVMLRLAPRAGDTVSMRLDQTVEISARAADAPAEAAEPATTTTLVLSRAIVESSGPAGTVLRTETDSVAISGVGADPRRLEKARLAMLGSRARIRLRPDGAMESLDPPADDGSAPRIPAMPASLPGHPVAVGESWAQAMPLPEAAAIAGKGGTLAVRFHLDSLTRGGDLAWVSLRGDLSRGDGVDARGARYATAGKVTGQLVLDRRRGWLADSYTAFVVDAVITPPPDAGAKPMKVRMKVVQRLRAR